MATTTTNFGWAIPQSTDLVKDGATAIATLGQAIDTTANTTFRGGLTKISTTTFSAVSSQSVNDVFSATYDNYLIITNLTAPSTNVSVNMRLRVSATDTSTNYGYASFYSYISIAAGGTESNLGNAKTSFERIVHGSTTGGGSSTCYLFRPFATVETTGYAIGMDYDSNAGAVFFGKGYRHAVATSFTGFTLIPSTSTISGTVTVYGVSK
jgi:hypothetical protein